MNIDVTTVEEDKEREELVTPMEEKVVDKEAVKGTRKRKEREGRVARESRWI